MRVSQILKFGTLRCRTVDFVIALVFLISAEQTSAQQWVDYATVSATAGLASNRLCYSDGRDIACDSNAPYLDANGNVGIGTTNPAYSLHIESATAVARLQGSGATMDIAAGPASAYFNLYHAVPMMFSTSGTERMRIASNGNVGIGTTNPSAPLQVSGSIKSVSTGGNGEVAIYDTTNGGWSIFSQASNLRFGRVNTSGSWQANYMTLDPSGSVGIGTTNPSYKLDVATGLAQSSSGIGVYNSDFHSVAIRPSQPPGGANPLVQGGDTAIIFSNNLIDTGRMVIGPWTNYMRGLVIRGDASYAGFGVVTPTANLEVSGTVSATRFVGDGAGLSGIAASSPGAPATAIQYNDNGVLAGSNFYYISSTGRFGISDSNPSSGRLSINGAMNLGGDLNLTRRYDGFAGGASIVVDNVTTTALYLQKSGGGNINSIGLLANNTYASGKLGVGAWAGVPLDVYAPSYAYGRIYAGDSTEAALLTSTTTGYFGAGTYGSRYVINDYKNAATRLVIDGSGNVGIGMTPQVALDVSGAVSVRVPATDFGYGGQLYMQDLGGNWATTLAGYEMAFNTGNNTARTERMRIAYNGKVGIGTTSPSSPLHVVGVGGSGVPSFGPEVAGLFQNNMISGSWSAISILGGTNGRSQLYFSDNAAQSPGSIQYDHSNNSLIFAANSGERMRIASNGNVGIAKTSPAYPLDISGTLQIDGTVNSWRFLRFATSNSARWDVGALNGLESGGNIGSYFYISRFNDAGGYLSTPFIINRNTGNVGVSISSPNATLEVGGTISATNLVLSGGCMGCGGGQTATDRISTSGVASGANLGMAVADNGTISFTLAGMAGAAYLHPTLGFVGPGVSTTGSISGSNGYLSGALKLTGENNTPTNQPVVILSSTINRGTLTLNVVSGNGNASNFSTAGDAVIRTGANAAGDGGNLLLTARTVTGSILFGTGIPDTEKMRIASNGNVGIGTVAPPADAMLDIVSSSNGIIRARMYNTSAGAAAQARYDLSTGVANTYGIWSLQNNSGNPWSEISFGAGVTGGLYLTTAASGAPIIFRPSNTEAMRIAGNGNVGIGTSGPGYALDVRSASNTTVHIMGNTSTVRGGMAADTPSVGAFYAGSFSTHPYVLGANNAEFMRITTGGFVGIGTASPSGSLHVQNINQPIIFTPSSPGTMTSNGYGVEIRSAAYTAGQYASRFVKYDNGGGIPMYLQMNNAFGNNWYNIARFGAYAGNSNFLEVYGPVSVTALTVNGVSITGGGGGGSLAALSDVSASSPASGMLLRYNGSKWESVGASTALSTTTIYTNWPDAILCDGSSGKVVVYNEVINSGNGLHYYNTVGASGSTIRILYNPDGSYNSYSNGGYAGYFENCATNAWSISQLYALGRAYNFIGSNLSSAAIPNNSLQYNNNGGLAGSGVAYISSSGYVGINNTNPSQRLSVQGSLTLGNGGGYLYFRNNGNTADLPAMATNSFDNTLYLYSRGSGLRVQNAANTASLVTISDSGQVGIGLTPSAELDVSGSVALRNNGQVTVGNGSFYTALTFNHLTTGGGQPLHINYNNGQNILMFAGGAGNLGISESNPTERLTIGNNPSIFLQGNSSNWGYKLNVTDYGGGNVPLRFVRRNAGTDTEMMKLDQAGNLSISGGVSASGAVSSASTGYFGSNVTAAAYLHTSDRNLKANISRVSDSMALLAGINGVHFSWKKNGEPAYGVIAQDVQKVMPEAVKRGGPSGTLVVDYDQLVAPLIEAVKTQQRQIGVQQHRIDDLERTVRQLQQEIR